jgi:hypothetical protein
MAHVFLSLGQLAQVQTVASAAVSGLDRQVTTPEVLSLRGAFRLVLAVTAARENDRTQAYAYLDQAREIASQLGEDRNDFGTEFGPTNVGLHAVSVAVELGDAGRALDLAHGIDPEQLSAERQARYSIDLALAHFMRRQIGESLHCLQLAEELTPEQTRNCQRPSCGPRWWPVKSPHPPGWLAGFQGGSSFGSGFAHAVGVAAGDDDAGVVE